MRKRLFAFALFAFAPLLLVGCETQPGADYEALESELVALREDYDALATEFETFQEEWGTFYEDWGTFYEGEAAPAEEGAAVE